MTTAYEVFFHPQNRAVTHKLMLYTAVMFSFPICTFYFSFYVLFKGDHSMLGWSGILAVVAANIVIAAYVVMAWREDQEESQKEAQQRLVESDSQPLAEKKKDL
eukprot:gene8971-9904_t